MNLLQRTCWLIATWPEQGAGRAIQLDAVSLLSKNQASNLQLLEVSVNKHVYH